MRLETRCFKCREHGYLSFECLSTNNCTVEGCDKPHPPSLYYVLSQPNASAGRQPAAARGTVPAAETTAPAPSEGPRLVIMLLGGSDKLICQKSVSVDPTLDGCPSSILVHEVLDEPSNTKILEDRVLDLFGLPFPQTAYDLIPSDAKNAKRTVGRLVSGLNVAGVLSQTPIPQNDVHTIDEFAASRDQVATPEIAMWQRHIAPYESEFSPFDPSASVSLLIGTNNEHALGTHVPLPDVYLLLHKTNQGHALLGQSRAPIAPIAWVRPSLVPHTPPDFSFRVMKVSSHSNSPCFPFKSP